MHLPKEQDIQSAIVEYLHYQERKGKLFFFRSAAGAVKTESGRYFKTGRAGVQDITVLTKYGKYIALEVKAGKGRQSETQREVEGKIKALGGHYFIVRSVNDVHETLKPFL